MKPAQLPKVETQLSWVQAAPGLDWQRRRLAYEGHSYELVVLRVEDKLFAWDIHYFQEPKRLTDWAKDLRTQAVLNGSFFTETYTPTGSFIANDGQTYGSTSYSGKTVGTVDIQDGGLRLLTEPPQPADKPHFQSFPLLVSHGGLVQVPTESDKIARRTIIAQNLAGQSFVILFDTTPVTLYDAARILASQSDLALDWALNLDGGPSSGLVVQADDPAADVTILPAIELPIVLSIRPRTEMP